MTRHVVKRLGTTLVIGVTFVACASATRKPAAPAAAPAYQSAPDMSSDSIKGVPGQAPKSLRSSPSSDEAERETAAAPPTASDIATNGSQAHDHRTAALRQASSEIEASQRELDVAGGDCRNACRALGSMDRAAGHLCGLAQSTDEQRRCGEVTMSVRNARDKVKRMCGSCPDVSVDRGAPVPSH